MKLAKRRVKQYSKDWMTRWQYFTMFWLSVFFVADIYFNHCEHLEALCITLVTSIIATIIPYFAKSYFETKEQEKMNLSVRQYEDTINNIDGGIG